MKLKAFILSTVIVLTVSSCYRDESVDSNKITHTPSDDEIDKYIQKYFTDEYGIAVRYKFVDRYIENGKRVAAPERNVVEPMLDFLTSYWIEPFLAVNNGDAFFRKLVPAEMVFIGSYIYNGDGTVTLGTADAGARITLTEVNNVNPDDIQWIYRQLGTIYHEFAHIMHQNYNLPPSWKTISPDGYTSSGSWYNLTDQEALQRGFVSPYATSSFNEDFAEMVAHILYRPDFYTLYYNDEQNCTDTECEKRNAGRNKIRSKYDAVLTHYKQYTGVDLLEVRKIVQDKYPK